MLALTTMGSCSAGPATPSLSLPKHNQITLQFQLQLSHKNHLSLPITTPPNSLTITHSSNSTALSWSETDQESEQEFEDPTEDEEEEEEDGEGSINSRASAVAMMGHAPPVRTRRRRYRKEYPGEKKGITEEMRFVAMKLRNSGKPKKAKDRNKGSNKIEDNDDVKEELSDSNGEGGMAVSSNEENGEDEQNEECWEPSIEGFLKYLVDSKLVFATIERIVDESSDVSYAYFRKTGLERAECLSEDLEWFSQQGNSIPEPSNPGVTYAKYLEELAEKSPPLFMSHFYNIYFSHIAGGQVIAKKVCKKLLEGRELELFKWERNEEELLRDTRQKLNMLGEHWSRDEKNKCLREATKAFRFLGQIVRLIIL